MRRRWAKFVLAVGFALATLIAAQVRADEDVKVASPDGRVKFRASQRDVARLHYEITFGEAAVIEPSPIVVRVDDADTPSERVWQVKTDEHNKNYPWRGVTYSRRITIRESTAAARACRDKPSTHSRSAPSTTASLSGTSSPAVTGHELRTRGLFHSSPAEATVWYHDLEAALRGHTHQKRTSPKSPAASGSRRR